MKLLLPELKNIFTNLTRSQKNTVTDVVTDVKSLRSTANGYFSPYISKRETGRQTKSTATARFLILLDDKMIRLDEIDQHSQDKKDITLIIDRIVKEEEDFTTVCRCDTNCLYEGICHLQELNSDKKIFLFQ
jgi:hypothetical protein